jgi:hypothetical protein
VSQAVTTRHQLNVLHPASGLKIDFIVLTESEFDQSRRGRRRDLAVLPDRTVPFASPEDVIVKKLVYYQLDFPQFSHTWMPKASGKPRVAFDNAFFEGDEALTGNAPNREKPRENRHLMCEEIAESPDLRNICYISAGNSRENSPPMFGLLASRRQAPAW